MRLAFMGNPMSLFPAAWGSRPSLSLLYQSALQAYLKPGSDDNLDLACEVGRLAVTLGLETIDLAWVHERAFSSLARPDSSSACTHLYRAARFFAEVLTAIERPQRRALEDNKLLTAEVQELSQRNLHLSESVEGLQQEIIQHRSLEESLRLSEQDAHANEVGMRSMSHLLLTAQEDERGRISRELHDVIAQTLSGINLRLSALHVESTTGINQDDLRQSIRITQQLVEHSVDIVHRFARDLRPTMLDDLGLIPALQAHLRDYTEGTGIRVHLTVFAGIERCSSDLRTTLYRVAQEALVNVARHAQASRVAITIQELAGRIFMRIEDDGLGFEVLGKSSAKRNNRLGLMGMRERVEMLGGVFTLSSAPGKPTVILAEIPSGASARKSVPVRRLPLLAAQG